MQLSILILDYSLYFTVLREGRNIIVSVNENLPSEVVKEKSHLVLTILANPEGNADLIASAVLIIALPVVENAGRNLLKKRAFLLLNLVKCRTKLHKTKLRWLLHDCQRRA